MTDRIGVAAICLLISSAIYLIAGLAFVVAALSACPSYGNRGYPAHRAGLGLPDARGMHGSGASEVARGSRGDPSRWARARIAPRRLSCRV
jgi:hypothetical protein